MQLADGLVAASFGVFAIGDVAVVEGDTVFGWKNVNVNPDSKGLVKVLDLLRDPGMHGVEAGALEIGTHSSGKSSQ